MSALSSRIALCLLAALAARMANADLDLSKAIVYTQLGASQSDLGAAEDLSGHLSTHSGSEIRHKPNAQSTAGTAIFVGQGPIARKQFPEIKWQSLGLDEVILKTK